jgi:hypothetical protein
MQAVCVCADITPCITRYLAAGALRRILQPCHLSHVEASIVSKKGADSAAWRKAVGLKVQDSCPLSKATARTNIGFFEITNAKLFCRMLESICVSNYIPYNLILHLFLIRYSFLLL